MDDSEAEATMPAFRKEVQINELCCFIQQKCIVLAIDDLIDFIKNLSKLSFLR